MSSPFAAVNHVGFVVRNLDEGMRFFVEVLGFTAIADRRGELPPRDDVQTRRFGVDAMASGRYAFLRLGDAVIELLEWSAPDRNEIPPRNSDLGGRHLALTVSDMEAALAKLRAVEGVTIREPNDLGFIYVHTPLGLEIQLIPT